MRARLSPVVCLAGLVLLGAGCVSLKRTPEARFFVLESLTPPSGTLQAVEPVGVVGVENVSLPGHLERPQIVTWTAPNELRVDEFMRWAEPLDDGVTRTLAENLAGLLPRYRVIRKPWSRHDRMRCRVVVILREFGLRRDGTVRLAGRMALLPDTGELPLTMEPVSATRGPLPRGPEEGPSDPGVDAMSELLADLGRTIARAIEALPPEEVPVDEEPAPAPAEDAGER